MTPLIPKQKRILEARARMRVRGEPAAMPDNTARAGNYDPAAAMLETVCNCPRSIGVAVLIMTRTGVATGLADTRDPS